MSPRSFAFSLGLSLAASSAVAAGKAPTVDQALSLKPIQKGVEYDTPTGSEAKACTIKAEREGKSTSWVVRDSAGRVLRRFADANADNVVDTWCYYAGGLEVYRDIDSDYDSRADQYRWFHTGGSRWGLDSNEDTKIDSWKRISPQEVAEEAFYAVQTKDPARFERLLLSSSEAKSLGLGETLASKFAEQRRAASSDFKKLLADQKASRLEEPLRRFRRAPPRRDPGGARRLDEGCCRLRERVSADRHGRGAGATAPRVARPGR